MDLNELQSAKSRERQTADLQQLRASFYEEVGEYIDQLERERGRAAEAADDPFSDPQVQRLTDDIETAKGTVESLYERRIGKIVKQASLEAADMGAETGGLTAEERDAFERIVATIERNRERVLDGVVGGEDVDASADADGDVSTPPASRSDGEDDPEPGEPTAGGVPPDEDPAPDDVRPGATAGSDGERPIPDADGPGVLDEGVDAADLMGEAGGTPDRPAGERPVGTTDADSGVGTGTASGPDSGRPTESAPAEARRDGGGVDGASDTGDAVGADAGPRPDEGDADGGAEPVAHATVRVTADVGEILGVDDRAYDLSTEDVVRLPEANAEPLVERGAAERL